MVTVGYNEYAKKVYMSDNGKVCEGCCPQIHIYDDPSVIYDDPSSGPNYPSGEGNPCATCTGYTPKYIKLTISGVNAPLLDVCCNRAVNVSHKIVQAPLPNGTYILEQEATYCNWYSYPLTATVKHNVYNTTTPACYGNLDCTGCYTEVSNSNSSMRVTFTIGYFYILVVMGGRSAFYNANCTRADNYCTTGNYETCSNTIGNESCPPLGSGAVNPYSGGTATVEFL